MTFAPYWLMPAPWPLPETVKRKLRPVHARRKFAERSEKIERIFVPGTETSPTRTDETRPLGSTVRSPIQSGGWAGRSASGYAARNFSRKLSGENSAVVTKFGTSEAVSGLETLTRYGTSPPHTAAPLSVYPALEAWKHAVIGSPS